MCYKVKKINATWCLDNVLAFYYFSFFGFTFSFLAETAFLCRNLRARETKIPIKNDANPICHNQVFSFKYCTIVATKSSLKTQTIIMSGGLVKKVTLTKVFLD